MNYSVKKLIAEALKDQQNYFGDDLFTPLKNDFAQSKIAKKQIAQTKIAQTESNLQFDINLSKSEIKLQSKEQQLSNQIDFQPATSLDELKILISECKQCALAKTRNKFVFGTGNPNAKVMLVGEAPGADEDMQGEPFVGRAGKLLTDILSAIKFKREEVFIANILKCRPPNNRNPLPSEMKMCKPFLMKQIELIKPSIILCLGKVAGNALLENNLSLTKMRGLVHELKGIKLIVTYHPAALLRNPNWKYGCWEDVQKLRKLYDELK